MGGEPVSGRPDRPVVMGDVAALAGVSAMTVSRVLNSPEKVRPQTRERVLAAARALDYHPNTAARVLVTGRSGAVGIVGFGSLLYGPTSMLFGIEQAARRRDFGVSIVSLPALTRRSLPDAVERLRAQAVAGVVVLAPHLSAAESLHTLPDDLPAVAVGAAPGAGGLPRVVVDHRAGARRAVRHLLDLGHRTVWHVAGPADWVDAGERLRGWREALAGRERPEPLGGDWSARSGYERGRAIARDPRVTAVFAANDAMALGLLRALDEAGRRVPEDVSVAGFDDVPEAEHFPPPLTTVRQDFGEVGRRSFELLLGRMDGSAAEDAAAVVEPDLIVRESSGAVRTG